MQSACDGDVTLLWQQIMEARHLWQHTALEEALGCSRRDSSVSSPASNQSHCVVVVFIYDAQRSALQRLQCLRCATVRLERQTGQAYSSIGRITVL